MREWLRRHPALWRVAAVLAAAGLLTAAFVAFALGGCHDAGGFCAGTFSSTHVEAYASAAVLAALGAPLAAVTFSRRPVVLAGTAFGSAALVAAAAVLLESAG